MQLSTQINLYLWLLSLPHRWDRLACYAPFILGHFFKADVLLFRDGGSMCYCRNSCSSKRNRCLLHGVTCACRTIRLRGGRCASMTRHDNDMLGQSAARAHAFQLYNPHDPFETKAYKTRTEPESVYTARPSIYRSVRALEVVVVLFRSLSAPSPVGTTDEPS